MHQAVSTIMTTDVVTVTPQTSLAQVKDLIFEKHFHHIPVIENGKLAGIITSYDLVKLNKKFEEYSDLLVENVMTRKVVTLNPREKVGAAVRIFLRHLFHGLPIVDEDRTLVGIVTTHDVLKQHFDDVYPNDELEKAFRRRETFVH